MKKTIYLYFLIGLPLTALCRQELSKRAMTDSINAQQSIANLKQNIVVQPKQEASLYQALLQEQESRRQVFRQHWQTPSFREALARTRYVRDSIYQAVLGKEKYLQYRKVQQLDREQFELQQKLQYERGMDSLTHKKTQP